MFINICSKCAWVVPFKDKKGIGIANAFQIFLGESGCNLNKM